MVAPSTPSNVFWVTWAASIAAGFVLIWHDARYGEYGLVQFFPNPKFVAGLLMIVGAAFIAIGFALAGILE